MLALLGRLGKRWRWVAALRVADKAVGGELCVEQLLVEQHDIGVARPLLGRCSRRATFASGVGLVVASASQATGIGIDHQHTACLIDRDLLFIREPERLKYGVVTVAPRYGEVDASLGQRIGAIGIGLELFVLKLLVALVQRELHIVRAGEEHLDGLVERIGNRPCGLLPIIGK